MQQILRSKVYLSNKMETGLNRLIDETNNKYGFLTVLRRAPNEPDRDSARWECLCICGKIKNVRGHQLRQNRTKSCGCKTSDMKSGDKVKSIKEIFMGVQSAIYQWQAENKGREYRLTDEEMYALMIQNCHYCGIEPSNRFSPYLSKNGEIHGGVSFHRAQKVQMMYNGIDRKDNDIGYVVGNCVPCCIKCNRAKREIGYDEFIKWLDNLAKFRSKPL